MGWGGWGGVHGSVNKMSKMDGQDLGIHNSLDADHSLFHKDQSCGYHSTGIQKKKERERRGGGRPLTRPACAIVRSSTRSLISWPLAPNSAFAGALLSLDRKKWFPFPPAPPLAATKISPCFSRLPSSRPVSVFTIVPTGTWEGHRQVTDSYTGTGGGGGGIQTGNWFLYRNLGGTQTDSNWFLWLIQEPGGYTDRRVTDSCVEKWGALTHMHIHAHTHTDTHTHTHTNPHWQTDRHTLFPFCPPQYKCAQHFSHGRPLCDL